MTYTVDEICGLQVAARRVAHAPSHGSAVLGLMAKFAGLMSRWINPSACRLSTAPSMLSAMYCSPAGQREHLSTRRPQRHKSGTQRQDQVPFDTPQTGLQSQVSHQAAGAALAGVCLRTFATCASQRAPVSFGVRAHASLRMCAALGPSSSITMKNLQEQPQGMLPDG